MLTTLLCLALAAGPGFKLAAPEPSISGLEAKSGLVYYDYFTQQLAGHPGLTVVRESDIASLLGLERQKQLLGCAESSCGAELAGALGVDGLMRTNIARVGTGFVVGVTVLDAKQGTPIATFSGRPPDEAKLLDFLAATADALAFKLLGGETKPIAAETDRGSAWVVSAITTGALLVAGSALVGVAGSEEQALRTGTLPATQYEDVASARLAGQNHYALGLTLFGAAGLAAVTTATLFALPRSSPVRRWVPAIAGGVSLIAGGVLFGLSRADAGQADKATGIEAEDLHGSSEMKQTAAIALGACAVVGAVGTIILSLGNEDAPRAAISVTPSGAQVMFSMRWGA